jgi:hypothetical protein
MSGFESSIARLNAAVARHLTNADAVLDGVPVRVAFSNATREVLGGINVQQPTAGLQSHLAENATQDSWLRIVGGHNYRVTSIDPDGAGWTLLQLELAP